MGFTVMNFVVNTIDAILILLFIVKLLDKINIDIKRTMVFLLWAIIISTFIDEVFGLANVLGFILTLVVLTLSYSLLLKERIYTILLSSILAIILMLTIGIILGSIVVIIFNIPPAKILGLNLYRLIAFLGSRIIFYFTIEYLVNKLKPIKNYSLDKCEAIMLIGFFNLMFIYMAITLFKYMEEGNFAGYIYLMFMSMGSIIFSWLIHKITMDIMDKNQREIIWKVKEEKFFKGNFYERNIENILNAVKSQRHDLNNYLSTLYGLVYMESYEEAKEYIKSLDDRVNNMNVVIETNNPVISALISVKNSQALEHDIEMDVDIQIPKNLSLDFVDLSIIMGNLLDNALEACMLMSKDLRRIIQVRIHVYDSNLIIEIVNSKSRSIKVDTERIIGRFTTKEDKYNHGLGLGNIDFIVRQYEGIMKMEDLGDRFRVRIVLPMENLLEQEEILTSYST